MNGQRAGDRDGNSMKRGVVASDGGLLKLSGRPVGEQPGKREGFFCPGGPRLQLSPELWSSYYARHRSSPFAELQKGDLVWLEPKDYEAKSVTAADQVQSIQWARWGRGGTKATKVIPPAAQDVIPRCDGWVDEVRDLFGFVGSRGDESGAGQAGRVRPSNVVFDADRTEWVTLAVMGQPHPGCLGFYRNGQAHSVSNQSTLRGYKVYRTTSERGPEAPWHYEVQGVYDQHGRLRQPDGNLTASCELLNEGSEGWLELSLRSLSRREVSLLLAACAVDWRLGGGKPLGLGHCRVTKVELIDELGHRALEWAPVSADQAVELDRSRAGALPEDYQAELDAQLLGRMQCHQATQRPVKRLRYPRLTVNGSSGGHVWFSILCKPHENGPGLRPIRVTGQLRQTANNDDLIQGQCLPAFDPNLPHADLLYGYGVSLMRQGGNNAAVFDISAGAGQARDPVRGEPPAPAPNRDSRQADRRARD
jgi:hypothetical protein